MKLVARLGLGQVFWLSAAMTGALWLALPNSARAEVTVAGTSTDARIEASNATLEELLAALHEKLDLTYTSSAPLDHKVMDGTFVGPLTKILAPLLKDYDHFMKVQNGHISLVVTAQQKPTIKPSSTVAAGPPTSTASEPTEPTASSADASPKNEVATDSKNENVVTPNGPTPPAPTTPPSTSPPPSPFAVTTFLETQTAPFMNQGSTASRAAPPSQGAGSDQSQQAQQASQLASQQASQFSAQQAAVAQTMQRANVALQSMVGALSRLPQ
jgi:hypothetical protein